MNTTQLLDLFSIETGAATETTNMEEDTAMSGKRVVESLEELWDETQYDEYDLDSFIKQLN